MLQSTALSPQTHPRLSDGGGGGGGGGGFESKD